MTLNFSQNKWKVMTFALVSVIILGVILPQANGTTDISQLTQQILNIVKSPIFGNQAIKTAVDTANSKLDTLQTSVNGLDTSNLDAKVSSRATQTSVNSIPSMRVFTFAKVLSNDFDDSAAFQIQCDKPFTINSFIVYTNSTDNDDTFKLELFTSFNNTKGTDIKYVTDGPESAFLSADAVKEAGTPVTVYDSWGSVLVGQTERDGTADKVLGEAVISTSQNSACKTRTL